MKVIVFDKDKPDFKKVGESTFVSTLVIWNLLSPDKEKYSEFFEKEYVSGLELVDFAVRASFSYPKKLDFLLELVKLSRFLSSELDSLPFLSHAATETIMRNWHNMSPSEKDVHDWFTKNTSKVLDGGYQIIKRRNNKSHIPDFWISNSINIIPVEIKLHGFTEKNKLQLKRYMDFYGCEYGLAVGKSLNCELPPNVKFLKYDLAN